MFEAIWLGGATDCRIAGRTLMVAALRTVQCR